MAHLHPKITIGTKVKLEKLNGWHKVSFIKWDRKIFSVESFHNENLDAIRVERFSNVKKQKIRWGIPVDLGGYCDIESVRIYFDRDDCIKKKVEFFKDGELLKRFVGAEKETFGTDNFEEKLAIHGKKKIAGILCRLHKVEYFFTEYQEK